MEKGILQRALGGFTSQARSGLDGVANCRACSWNRPPIDRMANLNLEPGDSSLAEMIAAVAQDPEMIEKAKQKGAKGINLAGICCTANEILMRHGVPIAGNFLQQELAIITGAVDAMVVDVQCLFGSLPQVAACFHTDKFYCCIIQKTGKYPHGI